MRRLPWLLLLVASPLAGQTNYDTVQVRALTLSALYEKEWPGGHERFIRTLHEELSGR